MAADELNFRIETWDANEMHVEQLVATASNVIVAIAAFEKVAELYPKHIITLRNRAQVMRKREDSIPIYRDPGA